MFLDPIRKSHLVPPSDVNAIFSNVETLGRFCHCHQKTASHQRDIFLFAVNVNIQLLTQLSERVPQLNETGDMKVGDTFKNTVSWNAARKIAQSSASIRIYLLFARFNISKCTLCTVAISRLHFQRWSDATRTSSFKSCSRLVTHSQHGLVFSPS